MKNRIGVIAFMRPEGGKRSVFCDMCRKGKANS